MPLVLGIDLGTTKTTAIAVETETGDIVAQATESTIGNIAAPADRDRGRMEFDAVALARCGVACLRGIGQQLGSRSRDVVGLGITGQQHGTVIVDADLRPLTPFINWQDQRGNEIAADGKSWVTLANERVDPQIALRTGCRLRTGFLATTLFWMRAAEQLPSAGRACFLMDYFASTLTGEPLATDPSCAGSAGVFDVPTRSWSQPALAALGLSDVLLPEIREANERVGRLSDEMARETLLPIGMPVFVPIGDHQASFLGSVADRHESVLLNVGTGAQVAVFTSQCDYQLPIELRPFPISGNLLSFVGLCGGWSFQVVERFFRLVGEQLFGQTIDGSLYGKLAELATREAAGASGIECLPTFSGTRANPEQRGAFGSISSQNLTPGNFVRSLIEGMARDYQQAYAAIQSVTGESKSRLVTAGNGLRENALLSQSVEAAFGLPPVATRHREEAAFGAALIACVGAGVFPDLHAAGRLVRYA